MQNVVLSIKPEYAMQIVNGSKKYEYRKHLAKRESEYLYIYCTAPISKVIACVEIVGRISGSPSKVWEITKLYSGISRDKYRDYFKGCKNAYAYELGEVNVFDNPKDLAEFGINHVPQSFAYIQ